MPYNILLLKVLLIAGLPLLLCCSQEFARIGLTLQSAREAVGVRVAGNIVVVDEAHNLLDTIGALHSHDASLAMARVTGVH